MPVARRFRPTMIVAAVLAALLGLSACNAGAGSTEPGADTQQLTLGLVAEPASLDFTRTDGAAIPQVLLYNVYETLVKQNPEGAIVPGLAKEWSVSQDRRTYTFTLNSGVTFSNGAEFTAEDAVFSIDRVKSSDWTISLKSAMDVVEKAEAVSPTELRVTLSRPSNDWLFRMTTRIGAMFDSEGVADLANAPIGTGPYTFTTWNRGSSITLTRNEAYWGTKPAFATVVFTYFKDATALNNALLSNTIDVITTVQAPESLAQFEGGNYQVIEGTTNGEVLLSFNNSREPLKEKKVRQAVKYAIDHQALLDTCWAGKGTLIGSMVPPTDPWYEDLTGVYPHDPAKAKELLAGSKPTLRLRIPSLPYAISCGQVVKSQLEQVGFTVKLDQLEFPAAWVSDVLTDADYDMSIVAHVEPRDLPAVFGNPKYYLRYSNPELTKALAAADAGTEEEQVTQMKTAAKIITDDAAADWLFLLPNLMVAKPDITGLPKNAVTESFDLSTLGRS